MLDDLRNSVTSDLVEEPIVEEEVYIPQTSRKSHGPLLGMSPFQRFVIALLLFLMVVILGLMVLILFQKISPL
jgi:hypothetical protein